MHYDVLQCLFLRMWEGGSCPIESSTRIRCIPMFHWDVSLGSGRATSTEIALRFHSATIRDIAYVCPRGVERYDIIILEDCALGVSRVHVDVSSLYDCYVQKRSI